MDNTVKQEETQPKRYCRKCLLKDMDKNEYYKSVYEYIEGLDDTIKTDKDEFERRIGICRECEFLLEGMCRKCGCFVEMRAAVKKNYCPAVTDKWQKV